MTFLAHVLVLWDSSPAGANAAWPAALARLVEDAGRRLGLQVALERAAEDPLRECLHGARGGLLVVPTAGNPLRERILGLPVERLIQLSPAPVLLVKRPAVDAYGRVLLPLDLGEGSGLLLKMTARLAPEAATAVFHALPPGATHTDAAEGNMRSVRASRARRACQSIRSLLAPGDEASPHAGAAHVPVVAFGPAGETILAAETAHRPELVVLGKSRGGRLADFLLGDVTQQVVAHCEADVLVVPGAAPPRAGRPAPRLPAVGSATAHARHPGG